MGERRGRGSVICANALDSELVSLRSRGPSRTYAGVDLKSPFFSFLSSSCSSSLSTFNAACQGRLLFVYLLLLLQRRHQARKT